MEITVEEIANLTGLPVETIRQDKMEEHFRFSWRKHLPGILDFFIPNFLKPYRYLVYTVLATITVIFAIWFFLSFLLIAIALPSVILLLWILFLIPSTNADRLDFTRNAIYQLDASQQTALINLIHQTQEYNLLVRDLKRLDVTIPTDQASEQLDRDVAVSAFQLCRNTVIQALAVERQLRDEFMRAKRDWIKEIMPVLGDEIEANITGTQRDTSEPIIVASMLLLRQVKEKRERLRETVEDQVFEQTIKQQIEQAKVGRYGRVINQALQVIQTVSREVFALLGD